MELKTLEIKKDIRGSLVEAFKLPSDGQVFYVIANPGETRGLHYHQRKTETFLVIYGSAEISVKDRATGDIMHVELSGSKPISVKIVPNHTHSVEASDEGCIFLVWSDTYYDKDDPDTFGEEI